MKRLKRDWQRSAALNLSGLLKKWSRQGNAAFKPCRLLEKWSHQGSTASKIWRSIKKQSGNLKFLKIERQEGSGSKKTVNIHLSECDRHHAYIN